MRRDFERRLRLVEMANAGCGRIEIWVDQGDGTVRGAHGEQMMPEEAEALARTAKATPIFVSEADARL